MTIRIGFGYDVHRFMEGRPLILGGTEIPYSLGLWGHSDADVLIHALCDALLGAAGLEDIGTHFPDTDPTWKDISSIHILERVCQMVREKGYNPQQVDMTIVAQSPRLGPFIPRMKEVLSPVLNLPALQISIKAKTTEGLGFTGRGEGVAAYAVALLKGK